MITIGALAKTYRLLPSEVQANATTFDVMVMNTMLTWEQQRQSGSGSNGSRQINAGMTEDQLINMLQAARKEVKNG